MSNGIESLKVYYIELVALVLGARLLCSLLCSGYDVWTLWCNWELCAVCSTAGVSDAKHGSWL